MTLDHFDSCIIGAGVIGLAIGCELARAGQTVLVLEQHSRYGSETSSRNSEVIHAGIYYPTGSLKAELCVEGRDRLYHYCEHNRIPHRPIGKLIVAGPQQADALVQLQQQAAANNAGPLTWLDQKQLQQLEPEVRAEQALLSPHTGIISSQHLLDCLAAELQQHHGLLSLNTCFLAATRNGENYVVEVESVGEHYRFGCQHLINSAGLQATAIASRIEGVDPSSIPRLHFCKGSYFSLSGRAPFQHLIYPLPEANTTGLGIHATLDLAGNVRFGPDTEYLATPDYQVVTSRAPYFAAAIQRYYPGLQMDRLSPAYAGVRPKLQGPGDAPQDFRIDRSVPGLIQLFGIESPGLTSALALARRVRQWLLD